MSLKEKLASLFRGGEKKAEEPPVPAASEAQAAAPVEEKDQIGRASCRERV